MYLANMFLNLLDSALTSGKCPKVNFSLKIKSNELYKNNFRMKCSVSLKSSVAEIKQCNSYVPKILCRN